MLLKKSAFQKLTMFFAKSSLVLLVFGILFSHVNTALAYDFRPQCNANTCYFTPLAWIKQLYSDSGGSGKNGKINVAEKGATRYLENLYVFGIAVASALAVIMIVIGGVQYSSSDAIYGKAEGKGKIVSALTGLILALLSYTILNTINKNLVSVRFAPQKVKVDPSIAQSANLTPAVFPDAIQLGIPGVTDSLLIGGAATGGAVKTDSAFPNQDWNNYALEQIRQSGLMNITPVDAAKYFPGGIVTEQGWLNLIAGVAKEESGWKAKPDRYHETFGVDSVGLLSLSQEDKEARKYGYSNDDLENPYNNLKVGIEIMVRQLRDTPVISGKDAKGKYQGLSEYWSTLRR